MPWSCLCFPFWACIGVTKCFDCGSGNKRELIADLNKNWQVKLEINFLHPSCWPYQSGYGSGSCRLSCLISMGDFVLSVDEGRGQGEEGSPMQSQQLCICEGLRQRQMSSSCLLIKWVQGYYHNPDNVTVCLTPLGLSTLPVTCEPGSFSSKTSSDWVILFQNFSTPSYSLAFGHTA